MYDDEYRNLFIKTIMPIVEREDPTRQYLPSSPSNGVVSRRDNYISVNPQSNQYGDVHHYSDVNPLDWRTYPKTKFTSEYGFQSYASIKTLQGYIKDEDLVYPLSNSLKHRQHKPNGLPALLNCINQSFSLPREGNDRKSLEDFIYLSQVFQSMAIKIETEFYRRSRSLQSNGDGFNMGALYWQLNDIWPTVSWSSIEFGGKWKMLHYYVKNMFDNLLVDAYVDEGYLKVDVVRDDHYQGNVASRLTVQVYKWSQQNPAFALDVHPKTEHFRVNLVYLGNLNQILQKAECSSVDECFVTVSLKCEMGNETVTKNNFLLLAPIKNAVGLRRAQVKVNQVTGPITDRYGIYKFTIQLQSNAIAPFVWLDWPLSSTKTGIFSDNGFLLINETLIDFHTRENLSNTDIVKQLTIKSLGDVYYS